MAKKNEPVVEPKPRQRSELTLAATRETQAQRRLQACIETVHRLEAALHEANRRQTVLITEYKAACAERTALLPPEITQLVLVSQGPQHNAE